MAGDAADRTEAATPKRLAKARDEGRAPLSREVAVAAGLLAGGVAMMLTGGHAARQAAGTLAAMLAPPASADPLQAALRALRVAAGLALPFALAALAAAVLSVLGQTGFLVHLAALQPDLGRLRPRFSRLGGTRSLIEAGKALLKLVVGGAVAWMVLHAVLGQLMEGAVLWEPGSLPGRLVGWLLRLLLALAAAQGALAGLDLLRARVILAQSLRMSRHELREEQRESDGDPMIRARLRRLRLQRAKRRMMAAVPRATVVIVNPTHYAVALAYDRGAGGAPRVVAKGVDALAARIREAAALARVPLVANPPLARALWRVELDSEIPGALFQAVAEIIASVWRLRTPARIAASRRPAP